MSDRDALYPELPEAGKQEAAALIERFKEQLKKAAEEVLGDLYCDVPMWIETDAWTNLREALLAGLCNYGNRQGRHDYDFYQIRRAIFEQYRNEIISDLNQDLMVENERLKREVEKLHQDLQACFRRMKDLPFPPLTPQ